VRWPGALLLLLGAVRTASAQDASSRAIDLERRGDYPGAAAAWRSQLTTNPADLAALLGLERALSPLGRLPEMVEPVQTALRRDASSGVLGIAIRVYTAARQPDSARAAVERWSRLEPGSEMPFQEWGLAAYSARDRASAKAAYLLGRQKLGRPDAMAAELGQLAVAEAEYGDAAREWSLAIQRNPAYRSSALGILAQVPVAGRATLLRELGKVGDLSGQRLAVALEIRWGQPLAAARRLLAALSKSGGDDVPALQETLEDLRGSQSAERAIARAMVLEQLGERAQGSQRARIRLEAAQAYADGGDQASARKMLGTLAGDPSATAAMAASASSTLVGVLVDEGGIEEADRKFRELSPLLGAEDRQRLALRLAQGWIRNGRLTQADSLLAADSSIDAEAIRGRIALFRGDLARARTLLGDAGPFTGDRAAATERAGILGLLQLLEEDSLPALGEAFYRLERRDSAGAAAGFEKLAATMAPDHGGGELLLLAGEVRAGLGQNPEAEKLYRSVVAQAFPASAAAAEFALAGLFLKSARKEQAVAALEHLLVTWPTSAVVPQARRLLDVARGAVPAT